MEHGKMTAKDLKDEIAILLEQKAYHERQIAFLESKLPLMTMQLNELTLEEHFADVLR
jgi:hypothetical protein